MECVSLANTIPQLQDNRSNISIKGLHCELHTILLMLDWVGLEYVDAVLNSTLDLQGIINCWFQEGFQYITGTF